jgi:hypothetical protein
MNYTGMQLSLLEAAKKYSSLGYKIGICTNKVLDKQFVSSSHYDGDWNAISIILDGIVCVDFDTPSMDIGEFLPPTLKEKSPRGYHLFYRLPKNAFADPKIHWKKNVDLLVQNKNSKNTVKYGATANVDFGGHVLCSPSPGYTRVYPEDTPSKDKIEPAPAWLITALSA